MPVERQPPASPIDRLRQPATIASIVVPLSLLLMGIVALPGFHLDQVAGAIGRANPWLLVTALAVYFASFPIRGERWRSLLRGAGMEVRFRDATEILFLSWFVNCLVPAKLGDVYRAYLLRMSNGVSLSATLGTVLIERFLDIQVMAILGLIAGYVSFARGVPPVVTIVFGLAAVTAIGLFAALLMLRSLGASLVARLPLPRRAADAYGRFQAGLFASASPRTLPGLVGLTVLIWASEAAHLALVILALGFTDVHLGISAIVFVALAGALLTAVPLSPAGLGAVETGMVGILTLAYGVPASEALAIAVVDRAITVLSVVIIGAIAYLLSDKTARSRRPPVVDSAPGPALGPKP